MTLTILLGRVSMNRLDVAIVQILLVGSIGILFYYLLQGLGQKQMAGLMRVVTVMVLIAIAVPAVWSFLLGVQEGIQAGVDKVDGWVDALTFWR